MPLALEYVIKYLFDGNHLQVCWSNYTSIILLIYFRTLILQGKDFIKALSDPPGRVITKLQFLSHIRGVGGDINQETFVKVIALEIFLKVIALEHRPTKRLRFSHKIIKHSHIRG